MHLRKLLAIWILAAIAINSFSCTGNDSTDNGDNNSSGENGGPGAIDSEFSIDDPLFDQSTTTMAEWITPEWYTCETEQSACGLPCPSNDLWVAINPEDFRGSAVCSACMSVAGPNGTVVVEVIENCGGACASGEIELSRSAFDAIAVLDEGRAQVSWRLVPCEREGPISFSYERDSDHFWAGIQVRNPALPVAKLEIRYGSEDWTVLERDGWDHFPVSGDLGSGPFDFRVTAIDGQQLLEEEVAYRPGGVVQGRGQFEI